MMNKEHREFAKQQLDSRREVLRTASHFSCACCEKQKAKNEAAGAHLYKTEDEMLLRAMKMPDGRMRIGTYVLCLECVDSMPDDTIQQNVTKNLAKEGLFGNPI